MTGAPDISGISRGQIPARVGYLDVKRAVMERIREGVWGPGALLPGEVALAEALGCARATVNRALTELSEEGVIDRKRRAGSRVRLSPRRQARLEIPLIREEIEASGGAYGYSLIHREMQSAPDWLRGRLRLEADAEAVHVVCVHYADDRPFQIEERWIVVATVPAVATVDFIQEGPNDWLVATVPFTDLDVSLGAEPASHTVADHLSLTPGEPVFTAERTTWLDGRPVTFARLSFRRGYRMTLAS